MTRNSLPYFFVMLGSTISLSSVLYKANGQSIPDGSYKKTCQIISVKGFILTAVCKAKDGKTKINKFNFKNCIGGIENVNGFLTCTYGDNPMNNTVDKAEKDKLAKQKEQEEKEAKIKEMNVVLASAKPALRSAAAVVLGREASMLDIAKWVNQMQQTDKTNAQLKVGLTYTEAVEYLKNLISKTEASVMRTDAIDGAFQEVYGRNTTPAEQAVWDSKVKEKKAWYITIVAGERAKKHTSEERTAMLNRAYLKSLGRKANESDLAYWLPRNEHFRLIVEASRSWLYSPQGVNDLIETIKRALAVNSGNPNMLIDDASIKSAMTQYSGKKAIYVEMINTIK